MAKGNEKESKNPCTFKKVCANCKAVAIADRPTMCSDLDCKDYKPCRKCNNNRSVNEKGICGVCTRNKINDTRVVKNASGKRVVVNDPAPSNDDLSSPSGREIDLDISLPGNPPADYNEDERRYYEDQWQEYSGFYRDPTAYFLVHQIILLEIELSYVTAYMIRTRGERAAAFDKQKNELIKNLGQLRNQLPEKEAMELSDDEKSMAMLYKSYIEEKGLEEKYGKYSRVISPEAVALAPTLKFPVDLYEILDRLKYDVIDIEEAVQHFETLEDQPDSRELAELLGFPLREELALTEVPKESEDFFKPEEGAEW